MRKSVVAGFGVVLVAAAVALFFLLTQGEGNARLRLVSEPDGARAKGAGAPAHAVDPVESRPFDAIRPTAYVEPESGPDTRRTAAEDDSLRVLVVEETSGLPVPEAEVAWVHELLEPERPRSMYTNPPSVVADFDHAARRALADLRGIATVRTSDRLAIAARSGTMFGYRRFARAPRGEVRVAIQRGVFAAARVVTSAGEAVPGMPVRIDIVRSRGSKSTESRTINALSRAPDGLAIAEHLPASLDDANQKLEVSAVLEGANPKDSVKASLDKLKEGPILLVVGAMGKVNVKVQDGEGKPFHGDARLSLVVTPVRKAWPADLRAVASGGAAQFPWVPVGQVLTLSVEADGLDSIQGQKVGPLSAAGEEITVEARLARKRAVITGRAVNESASPIANASLHGEVMLSSNGAAILMAPAQIATDAAGIFKLLVVDRVMLREGCDLELEARAGADQLERHGTVALPKASDGDEILVGDVRLARPEPLASGMVEDDLGAPVAGALVVATQITNQRGAVVGFAVGRGGLAIDRIRARTNEAGAFEIPLPVRARSRPVSFGLRAEAEGFVCPESPTGLRPGATSVKIVLRGTGVLGGKLLLPDPAPVRKLEVILKRSGVPAKEATQVFSDCVNSDGTFRIPGVLPGPASVSIRRTPAIDLAEVSDVVIPRLAETDDVRLRPLDLREHQALRP